MSKLLVGILLGYLLFAACDASAQFRSDSSGCPIPEGDTGGSFGGRRIPPHADMEQTLSPNRQWLAYVDAQGDGGAYVLNLATREEKPIVINSGFGNEQITTSTVPIWCPYDSSRVALIITSSIDTVGSGSSSVTVMNLYDYNILTGESKRITPLKLGRFGPRGMSSRLEWLASSRPGFDTFILGWGGVSSPDHKPFYGKYSPQTNTLVPLYYSIATDTLRRSDDGAHVVWFKRDTLTGSVIQPYYFDQSEINFSHPLDSTFGVQRVSFSPNGKLVAYEAFPLGFGAPADSIFEQIWICSTSNPGRILNVINYQNLFCMYSFWGAYPEMVSDSSLVVSMHKDGDTKSPLWEITLDGRIVRQLTFLAHSKVEPATIPENTFVVTQNPFTIRTAVLFSLADDAEVEVNVCDVLGRSIPRLRRGERFSPGNHSFQLNFEDEPAGSYFARIRVNGNPIKSIRMEKTAD